MLRQTDGRTPVCIAAYHGRLEVVKYLAARGADLNKTTVYRSAYYVRARLPSPPPSLGAL